jgi:hypothetical protein
MDIILYKTIDSPNTINKTLTDPLTLEINLKKDTNIINPELVLNGDFRGFNYAHIPELSRYYFIGSMEQLNFTLVKLYLECDVLETYKADILNSPCKFNADIKAGDYLPFTGSSNFTEDSEVFSNVEIDLTPSIIISTIEV